MLEIYNNFLCMGLYVLQMQGLHREKNKADFTEIVALFFFQRMYLKKG